MNCNICEEPLKSSFQCGAHVGCYARANPPRVAKTARDLIVFADDPVIARNVLLDLIDKIDAISIDIALNSYNKRIMQLWQARCEIFPAGE
jgi:hypothetical protein